MQIRLIFRPRPADERNGILQISKIMERMPRCFQGIEEKGEHHGWSHLDLQHFVSGDLDFCGNAGPSLFLTKVQRKEMKMKMKMKK